VELGGADPLARVAEATADATAAAFAVGSTQLRPDFATLDPRVGRDAAASAAIAGHTARPGASALTDAADHSVFSTTVVAPPGSAPAGSSLLAVLAGYILPGSGPAPAATMMMLILLGLIMAAVYAPRPQGSEKLYLSGLLGPRAGHSMAVRRPG
jgi:hypothetical protein